MFTAAGRRLAAEQGAKTRAFFAELLDDLERWGIAAFECRTIVLEGNFDRRDGGTVARLEATIVMPRACPDCRSRLDLTHRRERGVKCEKLVARYACTRCTLTREIAFCLPVFA
jgi:hypothetical protein